MTEVEAWLARIHEVCGPVVTIHFPQSHRDELAPYITGRKGKQDLWIWEARAAFRDQDRTEIIRRDAHCFHADWLEDPQPAREGSISIARWKEIRNSTDNPQAYVAQRLRELADHLEAENWPLVYSCEIALPGQPLLDPKDLMTHISITLSHPWPG